MTGFPLLQGGGSTKKCWGSFFPVLEVSAIMKGGGAQKVSTL